MSSDGTPHNPSSLRERAAVEAEHGNAGRFYEDVSVDDELTPLSKDIDLPHMMAYGAATWDFIRVHYDADYVRNLGFPGPFVDGQMLGALLAQLVQDWAGPAAFLCKLAFRNRVMVYPGDTLVCGGVVTGLQQESAGDDKTQGLAECDLWIENQRGERVVDRASAVVRLPLRKA